MASGSASRSASSSAAPTALGSVGEYKWGGWAGTGFWISPRDSMFAILMVQAPDFRDNLREIFRNLVYAALD